MLFFPSLNALCNFSLSEDSNILQVLFSGRFLCLNNLVFGLQRDWLSSLNSLKT